MEGLKKKEKRELLARVTPLVGLALELFAQEGKWTDVEIAKETGVPPNRITEYKNFEKHGRVVSEKHLLAFVTKGIVTVAELKSEAKTQAEKDFLDALGSLESESLRLKILAVQRAGIDLEAVLDDILRGR